MKQEAGKVYRFTEVFSRNKEHRRRANASVLVAMEKEKKRRNPAKEQREGKSLQQTERQT